MASFRISEQDEQEIRHLARDPRIGQKVLQSLRYGVLSESESSKCIRPASNKYRPSVSHFFGLIGIVDQFNCSIDLRPQRYQDRHRALVVWWCIETCTFQIQSIQKSKCSTLCGSQYGGGGGGGGGGDDVIIRLHRVVPKIDLAAYMLWIRLKPITTFVEISTS